MKLSAALYLLALLAAGGAAAAELDRSDNAMEPEIDACRASGLIALKETSPNVKDVALDMDSMRVIKMDKKIGSTEVKAIVLGDVQIEKTKSSKGKGLVCIIGDKGKVLLSFFTDQ